MSFNLLAPAEDQQCYSTRYKDSNISYQPSHECTHSVKPVNAMYDLATAVEDDEVSL